jgi:hypothetical protein
LLFESRYLLECVYKYINIVPVKIQGCNELKCRAAKSLESCEKIQRHRKKKIYLTVERLLSYPISFLWTKLYCIVGSSKQAGTAVGEITLISPTG